MLTLLREISLRHWLRSPLRSLLVVIGIALGIALYVATEAAAASMFAAFNEFVARVSGRADLTVESSGPGVPGELLAGVAETPGVAHAAASVEVSAQAPELHESLLVLGVDFLGDTHFLPFAIEEGDQRVIEDPLVFVNDPTALLLSKRFADRHGLKQDSRVSLLTSEGPKDFFVRGVLEDEGAAASFGGKIAVMFIDAAQVSFGRGTFVDRIDIALEKGADPEKVSASVQALGGALRVEAPARMGTRLRALTAPLHAALWVSGFLALLVGGFLVYNAVGVSVAQRRREIGLLRALGVTRRGTALLFCAEAAILALPGIALGLWLGQYLSRSTTATTLAAIDRMYASVPQVVPTLTPALAVQSLVAGLMMAVLAAYWPARRGASVDPALVIRGASQVEATPPAHKKLFVFGASMLAMAFVPVPLAPRWAGTLAISLAVLGAALATPAVVIVLRTLLLPAIDRTLGVPGRLGLDYVQRTLGRSTVNVLALMVAVGMSVSVGGWVSSLERSITRWAGQVSVADFTITQGSPVLDRRHVPLSADALARLEKSPDVAALQRFRMVNQEIAGHNIRLAATDTDTFLHYAGRLGKGWEVVEGEPLEIGALTREPAIIISENAARLLHAKAGDTLSLPTPRGDVPVKVRAIIVDYTSETGAAFIDRKYFLESFKDDVVDGCFVFLRPGVDLDAAEKRVQAALSNDQKNGAIFVSKTKAVEQHLVDTLHETFAYSRSVEWMTLLIALMGVIGTMAAAVIDRRREISMLRAIGATRRQVATAIVTEAGFLGLCAASAGIAVGLLQCWIFLSTLLATETGWRLEFVVPWEASLRTSLLVVATSALAGLLPALRAARATVATSTVDE